MTSYHLRRQEKAITATEEMLEIIAGQRYLTFALCKDNEPYLATVNYAFAPEENCFYFHAAPEGKKMDYLKANPLVWGQVLEDLGYLEGRCDHAFRTVQFRGRAELLEDREEKRRGLNLLVEQQESDPEPVKKRLIQEARLDKTAIVRIRVEAMWGKKSPQ